VNELRKKISDEESRLEIEGS
jgi:hypothetical protein